MRPRRRLQRFSLEGAFSMPITGPALRSAANAQPSTSAALDTASATADPPPTDHSSAAAPSEPKRAAAPPPPSLADLPPDLLSRGRRSFAKSL